MFIILFNAKSLIAKLNDNFFLLKLFQKNVFSKYKFSIKNKIKKHCINLKYF